MKSIFLLFCFAFTVFCSTTEEYASSSESSLSDIEGDSKSNGNYETDEDELIDRLYLGVIYNDVSEVQYAIDRGVQLNTALVNRRLLIYPLHAAIASFQTNSENRLEILKLLINAGADMEAVNYLGQTPLHYAIFHDSPKAVKILLENGANPNAYNELLGRTTLQEVLYKIVYGSSDEEIIELLIQYGADVNKAGADGRTPLHQSIIKGFKKTTELLIEKGANVNAVFSKWKMTPLHWITLFDSSFKGHENWTGDDRLKFALLLIQHGADVNAKDETNKTPLGLVKIPKCRLMNRIPNDDILAKPNENTC